MSKSSNKRINIQKGKDMWAVSEDRLKELIREYGYSEGVFSTDTDMISALKELLQLREKVRKLQGELMRYAIMDQIKPEDKR